MTYAAVEDHGGRGPFADAWSWWQAGRLRYNLALAAAGWLAYGLNAAISYGSGHPLWPDWRAAFSVTLSLGILYLVVMGIANVCYVLGPITEAMVRPADLERFRRATYGMGFWGSFALPFVLPALHGSRLIAG